jgi:glutaredoxin
MIWQSFVTILLLASTCVNAQAYRWVDDKGRVQFGNNPPANAKSVRRTDTQTPKPAEAAQQVPFEVLQAQKDFPVTLYTAPNCKQPCELARAALNRRGVPFAEVQVWNAETLDQLKTRVGSSDKVPAIVVGRTAVSGFDQAAYDGLLDSARYPREGAVAARSQPAPAPPDGYKPPPTAEPAQAEADTGAKAGPYDTSKLPSNQREGPGPYDTSKLPSNVREGPGPYDTSKLPSNRSGKPGPYVTPGSTQ